MGVLSSAWHLWNGDKKEYCCKYCGKKDYSIKALTKGKCSKNPDGKYHVPYSR